MADIKNIDLYDLLGITITATEQEIKKAYRKKALKCHPDKNPDNPLAAQQFHQLSQALEVLTDEAARGAYDKVLRAKQAAKLRTQVLDSKRRKLKEDLEAREKAASERQERQVNIVNEAKLQSEIERLRKQGSKQVEAEQEYIRLELEKELKKTVIQEESVATPRLKLKWKANKKDENNGGYNEENLTKFFGKYGSISCMIISSKKKGSGLIEFEDMEAADMACKIEHGLPENPLTVEWVNKPPVPRAPASSAPSDNTVDDLDYESIVLRRLRQAEERKRLTEELMKQDAS